VKSGKTGKHFRCRVLASFLQLFAAPVVGQHGNHLILPRFVSAKAIKVFCMACEPNWMKSWPDLLYFQDGKEPFCPSIMSLTLA